MRSAGRWGTGQIDVGLSGGDRQTGIVRTSSAPTEETLESIDEVGDRDTRRGLDGNVRLICAHENQG